MAEQSKSIAEGDRRILIFPATVKMQASEQQIHFILSVSQVEDIIREVEIRQIPFSPVFIDGVSRWREDVVPVLSFERCLGLKAEAIASVSRYILVRTGEKTKRRGLIKTASKIQMAKLPLECQPVDDFRWIPKKELVRGVYEWDAGYLIVTDVNKILSGQME